MSATTLDEITHSEIILSLILLKPGMKDFRFEDLTSGLKAASSEEPRLRISTDAVSNTFFFLDHYLQGDLTSPYYKLSREGADFLQKEYSIYSPELKNRLRELSEKVWRS